MGGDYSVEFCGGCHVDRTGDIGLFKIVSESGISAGVRRIEAFTGRGALALIEREQDVLREASSLLKTATEGLLDKLSGLLSQNKVLEKQLAQLKAQMAASAGDDLGSRAVELEGIKILVANIEGFNPKSLRDTVDQLKNKLGASVIVLACEVEGRVNLVAGVGEVTDRVKAGELVNMVAEQVGGKGGGRPEMAMAGGSQPENLSVAIACSRGYRLACSRNNLKWLVVQKFSRNSVSSVEDRGRRRKKYWFRDHGDGELSWFLR